MGLNSAILINVARSTLHGHPSIEREPAGSFNRVETFHVNYFPVELGLHGHEGRRWGRREGWTLAFSSTLDGEDRRKIRGDEGENTGKVSKAILENFEEDKFVTLFYVNRANFVCIGICIRKMNTLE